MNSSIKFFIFLISLPLFISCNDEFSQEIANQETTEQNPMLRQVTSNSIDGSLAKKAINNKCKFTFPYSIDEITNTTDQIDPTGSDSCDPPNFEINQNEPSILENFYNCTYNNNDPFPGGTSQAVCEDFTYHTLYSYCMDTGVLDILIDSDYSNYSNSNNITSILMGDIQENHFESIVAKAHEKVGNTSGYNFVDVAFFQNPSECNIGGNCVFELGGTGNMTYQGSRQVYFKYRKCAFVVGGGN
ncbi:MAG: hypothetical protein AB8H03_12240 [Saprospiraceae bacterium]